MSPKTEHETEHGQIEDLWRRIPLYSALMEVARRRLVSCGVVRYAPQEIIARAFEPTESVHVVLQGTVRIYHQATDGRELLGKFLQGPATFGVAEVLHDTPFLCNVVAMDQTTVGHLNRELYLSLLAEHPLAALEQLREVSGQLYAAVAGRSQLFCSLEERMARLLQTYAELFSEETSHGTLIRHPISKGQIGKALAVTDRAVARILAKWRKEGTVARQGDFLVITKTDEFAQLCTSTSDYLYSRSTELSQLGQPSPRRQAGLRVESGPVKLLGTATEVHQRLMIGRGADCEFQLAHETVSPVHCEVFRGTTGSRFWIRDCESLNRTLVNDRPIGQIAVLHDGDRITIGAISLLFTLHQVR